MAKATDRRSSVAAHETADGHDEPDPGPRRATRNSHSPVILAVTLLSMLGVVAYGLFLLNPANRGDFLPWFLVVFAEAILVFHALMGMWTILVGQRNPRTYDFYTAKRFLYDSDLNASYAVDDAPERWPLLINDEVVTVDVLITVYGEPLDVIRRTATAAMAIRGAHRTWILDDGDSDDVQRMAGALGCGYLRRTVHDSAKAGNVNHALGRTDGDFFVILDADFVPRPAFLEETLPFMHDARVAFVQTPQAYGNLHNVISRGAGYMQTMFYRFIQPGRNQFNAAFCVGTNVLFRRTAINEVGGMYTRSKSEDVWTSLMLHERGWRSVFIPEALAVGDAPDSIEAYSKQQLRWATGGFEILFTHNPLSPRRNLTLDQRFMYFVTATHYLTGIAPGILLFVPALEVFFDLRPVGATVGAATWILFYGGFYIMQVLLAMLILGTFRWEVLLLAACSYPIYLKALRNAMFAVDQKWSVTGTTGGKASPFGFMMPQVLTFVFLACTLLVSIWRDVTLGQLNLATVWLTINTLVLGVFVGVAFSEIRANRRGRAPRRLDRTEVTIEATAPETAPVPRSRGRAVEPATTAFHGRRFASHEDGDTITLPEIRPISDDFGHMPAPVTGRRHPDDTAGSGEVGAAPRWQRPMTRDRSWDDRPTPDTRPDTHQTWNEDQR
ncbi:glycosyltransferase family 2 protein [Raineyella fluvialis]|uniref:Glycosyltransferase n=1 Tax=Raineyella fluvialis TaxID=2662261 RepID=A0A5Q2FBT6_9ACTN|nr:glycosyltransferase family 2 protein [Raineyella fluvialis]QGF23861.1 glycosyltransferase [Raineyella fluvialis]